MSRVDPNNITVSNFGSELFLVLPGKNTQCICVSLIYVHDCALGFGKSVSDTMNKKVAGVLHIQEHERLASHFCMQFDLLVVGHCYTWQVQVLFSVNKSNIIHIKIPFYQSDHSHI